VLIYFFEAGGGWQGFDVVRLYTNIDQSDLKQALQYNTKQSIQYNTIQYIQYNTSSVTQMLTNPLQHAVQFEFLKALGGRLRKSISKLVVCCVSLAPSPWHTNNGLNDRQGGDPARWFK
jgi:hypothetical protein